MQLGFLNGISLVSERFQNHLYIPCEPPDGFIGLFLPRFAAGSSVARGHPLTSASVIAIPPSSELGVREQGRDPPTESIAIWIVQCTSADLVHAVTSQVPRYPTSSLHSPLSTGYWVGGRHTTKVVLRTWVPIINVRPVASVCWRENYETVL